MDIVNNDGEPLSRASACNLAAFCLIFVSSLALEVSWNRDIVTAATRYWWQPRLVSLLCVCALIQVLIQWLEGGYGNDGGSGETGRSKGFPVKRKDDDEK